MMLFYMHIAFLLSGASFHTNYATAHGMRGLASNDMVTMEKITDNATKSIAPLVHSKATPTITPIRVLSLNASSVPSSNITTTAPTTLSNNSLVYNTGKGTDNVTSAPTIIPSPIASSVYITTTAPTTLLNNSLVYNTGKGTDNVTSAPTVTPSPKHFIAMAADIYDFVIIGGGWAGLGAANKFMSNSMTNFKVLEARNYVGGRSKTVYDLGENVPFDLGSTWVQGTTNNPVQALVDTFGVKYGIDEDTEVAYDPNGLVLSDEHLQEIYSTYGVDDNDDGMEADDTFMAYRDWTMDEIEDDTLDLDLGTVANEYIKDHDMNEEQEEDFEFLLGSIIETSYGADVGDMSLRWFKWDESLEGGDHYMSVPGGGYSAVIDKYAEPIMPSIQLGAVVTKVNYSTSPVQVTYVSNGVESTILADRVLITLPLGVLKAGAVEFIPSFSNAGTKGKKKQTAIDQLGMGVLNKVALYWEGMLPSDVFWPKNRAWIHRIADLESQGNWTSFHNAYNMNGNTPILVGFISGHLAERMETLPDDQIMAQAVEVLRQMFGTTNVPQPSHSIITRWKAEPFSLGSYSFQHFGSYKFSRRDLGAPLYGKLFFAGEATHTKYPTTTHGALMSGVDAACTILKYSGNDYDC